MSLNGNGPVFEKPEEPDFIKRLKSGHSEKRASDALADRAEDAPALEDELPLVHGHHTEEDLVLLREQHGVRSKEAGSTNLGSRDTQSHVSLGEEDVLIDFKSKKEVESIPSTVRFGAQSVNSLQRQKRQKLQALKQKNSQEDGVDMRSVLGTQSALIKAKTSTSTCETDKTEKKKRKKMPLSFDEF